MNARPQLYSQYGFNGDSWLVSVSVKTDDKNSTKRSIFLDQPHFGFDREYLIEGVKDKAVAAYR